MAVRTVRIGQYPDYRDEVRGPLLEILASTANPGTYAAPEDVTGTFLEMGPDGLWTGASVGTLTQAQADAVLAAQGVKATLKVGVPAQVDGGPVTWRGAGAGGWVDAGSAAPSAIYNGTSIPFPPPSIDLIGARIPATNPAVVRGFSWLECDGTRWAPPPGEAILEYYSAPSLVDITPGVSPLVAVWESPAIIPDYMVPDKSVHRIKMNAYIKNTSTPVVGCMLMACISGSNPTDTEAIDYPLGARNFTPTANGYGVIPTAFGYAERDGSSMYKGLWAVGDTNALATMNSRGRAAFTNASTFSAGSMKAYVKAVTKHAADNIVLHWIRVEAGM